MFEPSSNETSSQNFPSFISDPVVTAKNIISACFYVGMEVDGQLDPLWNPKDQYNLTVRRANLERIDAVLFDLQRNDLLTPEVALSILADYPPVAYKLLIHRPYDVSATETVNLLAKAVVDKKTFRKAFTLLAKKWEPYQYHDSMLRGLFLLPLLSVGGESSCSIAEELMSPRQAYSFFKHFEYEVLANIISPSTFLWLYKRAMQHEHVKLGQAVHPSNLLVNDALVCLVSLVKYGAQFDFNEAILILTRSDAVAFLGRLFTEYDLVFNSVDHKTDGGNPFAFQFDQRLRYDLFLEKKRCQRQSIEQAFEHQLSLGLFNSFVSGSEARLSDEGITERINIALMRFFTADSSALLQLTPPEGRVVLERAELEKFVWAICSAPVVIKKLCQLSVVGKRDQLEIVERVVNWFCATSMLSVHLPGGKTVRPSDRDYFELGAVRAFHVFCQQQSSVAGKLAVFYRFSQFLLNDANSHPKKFTAYQQFLLRYIDNFGKDIGDEFWLAVFSAFDSVNVSRDALIHRVKEVPVEKLPMIAMTLGAVRLQGAGLYDERDPSTWAVPQQVLHKICHEKDPVKTSVLKALRSYVKYGESYDTAWDGHDPAGSVQRILILANQEAGRDMFFIDQLTLAINEQLSVLARVDNKEQQITLMLKEVLQAIWFVFRYEGVSSAVPKIKGRKSAALLLLAINLSKLSGCRFPLIECLAEPEVMAEDGHVINICELEGRRVKATSDGAQFGSQGIKGLLSGLLDSEIRRTASERDGARSQQSPAEIWKGEGSSIEKSVAIIRSMSRANRLDALFLGALEDLLQAALDNEELDDNEKIRCVITELLQATKEMLVLRSAGSEAEQLSEQAVRVITFLTEKLAGQLGYFNVRFTGLEALKQDHDAVISLELPDGQGSCRLSSEGASFSEKKAEAERLLTEITPQKRKPSVSVSVNPAAFTYPGGGPIPPQVSSHGASLRSDRTAKDGGSVSVELANHSNGLK